MGSTHINSFMELSRFYEFLRGDSDNATYANVNCSGEVISVKYFYEYSLIPGILLPILLSFFVQRQSCLRDKCDGRPGVAIPMNALDMRHNRIPYLLAFGAVVDSITNILAGHDVPFSSPTWPPYLRLLLKIIGVVVYGTVSYPLFAGISAESYLGYAIAFVFCLAHLAVHIYNLVICINTLDSMMVVVFVFRNIPPIIFLAVLACYLPYLVLLLHRDAEPLSVTARKEEIRRMRTYVTRLLRLKPKRSRVVRKLEEYNLKQRRGFYFPPRLLCTLLVSGVVLYTIALETFLQAVALIDYFLRFLAPYVKGDQRSLDEVFDNFLKNNVSDLVSLNIFLMDSLRIVIHMIFVSKVCVLVSLSIALVFTVVHFWHIIVNFRRNIFYAYEGKYPVVRQPSEMSPVSAIRGFCRYCGYQATYLVWGFFIQSFVLFWVTLSFSLAVIVPINHGFGGFWIDFLKEKWPVLVFGILIYVFQVLVVKYCFTADSGSVIAVKNRNAFFVWTYYLFFFDLFLGVVSCLFRIFKAVVIGIVLVGRVDYSLLNRTFEVSDSGFNTYCGFVLTEAAHNNPIMRTFLDVLYEEVKKSEVSANGSISNETESPNKQNEIEANSKHSQAESDVEVQMKSADCSTVVSKKRRLQSRTRWYLFYTLLRNMSLRVLRKRYIQELKLEKLEEERIEIEESTFL